MGHVDFRFSLYQQCPNPPSIQVTLLKQNTSGFGYRMKAPSFVNVDDNIDFKIEWPDAKGMLYIFGILLNVNFCTRISDILYMG